jgi:hypothetical protein
MPNKLGIAFFGMMVGARLMRRCSKEVRARFVDRR